MSQPRPVVIRIPRPYDTEDEFIRGDGLAIGRLSMILIGAPSRPPGITIRFEIVLRNGEPIFRGEGRVVALRVHQNGREGLEIRFTRLDSRSKALVEQVLALRRSGALTPVSMPPPSARDATNARAREFEVPRLTSPRQAATSPATDHVLDSTELVPIESTPSPAVDTVAAVTKTASLGLPSASAKQPSSPASENLQAPLDEDPTPFAPPVALEQFEQQAEGATDTKDTEPPSAAQDTPEQAFETRNEAQTKNIPSAEDESVKPQPMPEKPAASHSAKIAEHIESIEQSFDATSLKEALSRLRTRAGTFDSPPAGGEVLDRLRNKTAAS
ncbi:MAG TPA: hypothetical protein PKL24_11080 [Polyangiaceae bacterium]|nr:MAG: hypothetical protein BWY17_00190 [Deltaproteobacteria bacterium ADurb.Bin207]HNZ22680.1 hypothetical protein [Polyangiaceae bacterium]HOD21574.1 hypothetical protein [Polyangiaceae bacterium]HOE49276.1 hypothetical protein [Polyangiaceae bacterium]HOH00349.1 hypothetical protein [Polyangiaceae bacterium]